MESGCKMINILYVSPFGHIGGGEISILTTISAIDKSAFRPFLVSYEEGPFVERARADGIETAVFRRSGLWSEFTVVLSLVRHIKRNDIRLVHINSLDIRAAIAALIAGIPCIGHLRVVFPFTWRDRLVVRLSTVTIAVSQAVVDIFSGGSVYYKDKFILIPNMVEVPAGLSPAPLKKEFGIPDSMRLVGIVGRMDPVKGHDIFIEAARIVKGSAPDVRFFVIGGASRGDEKEEAYLEAQKDHARQAGLSDDIIFTGFRPDALAAIAALDVLVVPSRVIGKGAAQGTEGFGRVAIEAMAVGTPVVTSSAGGLPEIVDNGVTGMIVPVEDAAATAAAVIELMRNGNKADALRSSARKKFEAIYSLKAIGRLEDLYKSVAKGPVSCARAAKGMLLQAYFLLRFPVIYLLKIFIAAPQSEPNKVERILLIRPDRLGDFVLSLPVIDNLNSAYPSAQIDVLVRPYLAGLAATIPSINGVIPYKGNFDALKRLPGCRYDVAIDMVRDYRLGPALVTFLSKAPVRIGFRGGFREILFTHPVDSTGRPGKSMVEHNLDLLKPLGVPIRVAVPKIDVRKKENQGKTVIAIHPGGYYDSQRWPAGKFASLAAAIAAAYEVRIMVMGGPGDVKAVATIMEALSGRDAISVFPEMKDFAGTLSGCDLLVCNNSGPLHLAAALDVPTISIMGPTDPVLWWPKGKDQMVIRKAVDCSPCSLGRCGRHLCMDLITVDDVLKEVRNFMEKRYGRGG